MIICSKTSLNAVLEAKKELDYVETVILTGSECWDNPEIKNLENLLKATTTDLENFKPEDFDSSEQTAFIYLSSGTTGFPKGVISTHKNLRAPLSYFR